MFPRAEMTFFNFNNNQVRAAVRNLLCLATT